MVKVFNMVSDRGNPVASQFVIHDESGKVYFQSYNSLIAEYDWNTNRLTLGRHFDFSVTTVKYLHKWVNKYVPREIRYAIDAAPRDSYGTKLWYCITAGIIEYRGDMV